MSILATSQSFCGGTASSETATRPGGRRCGPAATRRRACSSRARIRLAAQVLLLAEIDGVPVGAAEAHVHPGEPADVEIAVLDAFRHRGVARALLHAVRNA